MPKKLFLKPLSQWPLCVTFWLILVFGHLLLVEILGELISLMYYIRDANTVPVATEPILVPAYITLYAYKIFALYAVFITRKNTNRPFWGKIMPWFIAAYLIWHYAMLKYGLMVGTENFSVYLCLHATGCLNYP